jgi:hypothetical protein
MNTLAPQRLICRVPYCGKPRYDGGDGERCTTHYRRMLERADAEVRAADLAAERAATVRTKLARSRKVEAPIRPWGTNPEASA